MIDHNTIDYEKDLEIDKYDLFKEWLKQPQLFYRYSRMAEDATNEEEKAKERLSVVDAELDKELRHNAEMNETKITEKSISSEITLNRKHQEAVEYYLEKKHEARILDKAVVRAMDHRKKALEKLVDLEISGYNAAPKEPKGKGINIKEKVADDKQYKNFDKKRR